VSHAQETVTQHWQSSNAVATGCMCLNQRIWASCKDSLASRNCRRLDGRHSNQL